MSGNSDRINQLKRREDLPKQEIIRGHDAFRRVMSRPAVFSGRYLRVFVEAERLTEEEFSQSPLFTSRVKVGFVVAKKKVRKAVMRNRIRRLMKEDYRRSDLREKTGDRSLQIIFSLTEEGYLLFRELPDTKSGIFADDLITISEKLRMHFQNK